MWNDKTNSSLVKGRSHNSITIDGFSSSFSKLSKLYEYFERKETLVDQKEGGFELIINGFRAKGRWVRWVRRFVCLKNKLTIIDKLDTKSKENVNLNFNFYGKLKIKDKNIFIIGEDKNTSFTFKSSAIVDSKKIIPKYEVLNGSHSEYYGDLKKSKVLTIGFIALGPIEIKSEFHFD